MEKTCPFKESRRSLRCLDDCALWDRREECCAFRSMAYDLDRIANALEEEE